MPSTHPPASRTSTARLRDLLTLLGEKGEVHVYESAAELNELLDAALDEARAEERKVLARLRNAVIRYMVAVGRAPLNYSEEETLAAYEEQEAAIKAAGNRLSGHKGSDFHRHSPEQTGNATHLGCGEPLDLSGDKESGR